MIRAIRTIIVLVLVGAVLAPPVYCADSRDRERITTEGEGEAEIQGQDASPARAEALRDALQKAFDNALGEILPSDLSLTARQDVANQLGSRLKRYLLQYRILSETPALEVFFVNVEATFSVPLIRDDLVKLGIISTEEGTGEPVEFFVRMHGVTSLRWYQELMQQFRNMAGVNSVTPYEIFGTEMVLRVEYKRSPDDLIGAISGLHSDEFTITLEQVNDREISVSLVPVGGRSTGE